MTSRLQHVPPGPVPPDRGESELDGVRRRMESDEMRAHRFETRPEVLEAEAHLIAAARPHVRRVTTDLALLLGLGYDLFAKYVSGARQMPFDVIAALALAGDKVPEAREWCLAFARELVGRWGWTLTPPKVGGDLVGLVARTDRLASQIAAGTLQDLAGDGEVDADEAAARLPLVREAVAATRQLEESMARLAAAGPKKGAAA